VATEEEAPFSSSLQNAGISNNAARTKTEQLATNPMYQE